MHNINPLKNQLNPICYLLALLGAHHILHLSRIRVKCRVLQLAHAPEEKTVPETDRPSVQAVLRISDTEDDYCE
jgi:hypothetical protein